MLDFVLEIGTEELPARFLKNLETEMQEKFTAGLSDANLDYVKLHVCSTPRRATVYIKKISPKSKINEEVISGPPVKIAKNSDGTLSKAGEGFIRTQGVQPDDVFTLKTEKGEYLAVRKKVGGESALSILAKLCQETISHLSFPKRMHWGDGDFTFARPLRWILALLGNEIVPFCVGEINSGRLTCGHRIHGAGPFELASANDYFRLLKEQAKITPEASARRQLIIDGGNKLAAEINGKILWKESLLDEVQGLCEHPVPLLGTFDASFLEVPQEVLITSMESHQKSFGVKNQNGELLPYFLTVLNVEPKEMELVQKGWERVLRARLEDARFFWKSDLSANFELWLAKLDKVIFLAPLGSMGNKTRRISALCGWLAEKLGNVDMLDAARAGRFSKADLVTEMVGEFDTLQGIMGAIYAERMGEKPLIAKALAEQYLPAGPESPLPKSICGAILSIADKADTLAGCFGLGMIPTGAADPYALRRCALGIARIIEDKKMRIGVNEIFAKAFELYEYWEVQLKLEPQDAQTKLHGFFAQRLKNHFIGQGTETILVESVLNADSNDVWAASARLKSLQSFSARPDFNEAVLTFKRAANIIRKQGQETMQGSNSLTGIYQASLLQEPAEQELATALSQLIPEFEKLWQEDRFDDLFELLYKLRPAVDNFFNQVMVICEDKNLRLNRLNMLQALVNCLSKLADFDALQV